MSLYQGQREEGEGCPQGEILIFSLLPTRAGCLKQCVHKFLVLMKGDKTVLHMAGMRLWNTAAWRKAWALRAASLAGSLDFIVFRRLHV